MTSPSIDFKEIHHFKSLATKWWDELGPFKSLHEINPVRLEFILKLALPHFNRGVTSNKPLKSLKVLDVGCGGGLISEPLARLGAEVTGIDATLENIEVASLHAESQGLKITYLNQPLEEIEGEEFDVILLLEILEHVKEPREFFKKAASLLKPEGLLYFSTLNKTPHSLILGIFMAEYVLRWVPRGTHQFEKFLKPSEVLSFLKEDSLKLQALQGISYSPLKRSWELSTNCKINYIGVASPLKL